jgi:hypothetical protein
MRLGLHPTQKGRLQCDQLHLPARDLGLDQQQIRSRYSLNLRRVCEQPLDQVSVLNTL